MTYKVSSGTLNSAHSLIVTTIEKIEILKKFLVFISSVFSVLITYVKLIRSFWLVLLVHVKLAKLNLAEATWSANGFQS